MKGTFGAFLRRPLIVAALLLTTLSTSVASAGATSVTTTTQASAQSICGIVANPAVHVISKNSPCVIRVRVGTNIRIKLRSGFRWGYPASNSRAVVVTTISRSSIGVSAATLHAAKVGHATIRTAGTVYCKPGVACPDLALLWSLKVIVT
jgi:uncharacterized membrane protein YdfJ with MMPL/SSD domain